MKDSGSLGHNDGGVHSEKGSDYGYILKRDPTVGANVECKKKRSIKVVSKDLALSNQRNRIAIN